MAENEQLQQEAVQQQRQTAASVQETSVLCKHCGAALENDSPFCPNCGERSGGEERVCEFCQTTTTKEFCPQCQRRVIPVACPACGAFSIYDACENCGAILNPTLQQALTQEVPAEPASMSAEETARIQAEFQALESEESPEFKAFQKKLLDRQILLEERDYFNKREKRIIKVFGSRPFTLELPDPKEEAFRMKAYAALEKMVIAREEAAIEAELEKMFPPPEETFDAAEFARQREEMDKTFSERAGQVKSDVEAYKREAERQRQMEIERQKMLEKLRKNGVFYWGNPASDYEYIQIIISDGVAKCMHHCGGHGDNFGIFSVFIDGYNVTIGPGAMSYKDCPLSHKNMHKFTGTLNEAATVLTGYWDSQEVTHFRK